MTTVINSSGNSNNDNEEVKEKEREANIIQFRTIKRDKSDYPYVPHKYEDIFFIEILDSDGKKVLDYQKITKQEADRIRKKKNQKSK
jgi:hypothetical protein